MCLALTNTSLKLAIFVWNVQDFQFFLGEIQGQSTSPLAPTLLLSFLYATLKTWKISFRWPHISTASGIRIQIWGGGIEFASPRGRINCIHILHDNVKFPVQCYYSTLWEIVISKKNILGEGVRFVVHMHNTYLPMKCQISRVFS